MTGGANEDRVADERRRIRYAVVGLGHIAQAAVLPAFRQAQESSCLTAIVSGDQEKCEQLRKRYRLKHIYSYEQFDECLASGDIDAVYIALPNDMHCEHRQPSRMNSLSGRLRHLALRLP